MVSKQMKNNNGDLTGEEVVISGISGIFPNSNSASEFMENLYNKVDMVTKDDRFKIDHAELPKYSGKITGIRKFDAHFFRVTTLQARTMDPICRKLMEHTYSAMYDAGVNPLSYKGKKIGVFTCSNYEEVIETMLIDNKDFNKFSLSGVCKNMLANRISYWLDSKGPSYTIESFLGSTLCLEHAYKSIKTGLCDAAIVAGSDFGNNETVSVNMRLAGLLCMDGKTRCFDKNGDGYARSQALGVLFLQKSKDAKRIYAEVIKIGSEYGIKQGAGFDQNREPTKIVNFLKNIYTDLDLPPEKIEYVEANGAANPRADSNELQAIGQVFGEHKTVKVGCVKSNMGNSESYSAVVAVIKLCLAYHKGKIAGNLHYNDPLDISAINEHKIEVLTDNASFNRGFTAINNFPFDGNNSHVVLKGHFKPKNLNFYKSNLPRLVFIAGRNEEGVKKVFDGLTSKPIDPEVIGLLNSIYETDTPGFTCRGYTVLDTIDRKTVSLAQLTKLYQGFRRPLWFVYSGMGAQWAGMGTDLMRIPIFAAAIEKCRKVLEPKGVDIVRILTEPDKTLFDNVLNSFVGIAAVQIGLTDILKEMGLVPDYIIGHSLGELGCAYCDGCLSAEETILVAYARGIASIKCELIKGLMAAVGLGYKDILPLCPPEIDVACHNSADFCTLSGPADKMETFVTDLNAKGIFAKVVPSSNIAYHSRYIQEAGPEYLKQLKNIIKEPVQRSNNWISTSFPEENLDEPTAALSSPEYFTNNLLFDVAFSRLYQEGYDMKISVLYPEVMYPVSTETPLLSHLVEWYHEEDWFTNAYANNKKVDTIFIPSRTVFISLQDDDYKFLAGHIREGHIVLPEAAVLFYVWETLAMYSGVNYKDMSVDFHDVQFHAEVILDLTKTVNLKFSINKGNDYFEVTIDDAIISNGYINSVTKFKENFQIADTENYQNDIQLASDDIYKLMALKGHYYHNYFQSIYSASSEWNSAQIKFSGNWIFFLDSLIQLNLLARNHDGISTAKIIKEIKIDTKVQATYPKINDGQHILLDAQLCKTTGVTKCGGVKIHHIFFDDQPVPEYTPDVLKTMSLLPYDIEEPNQEKCYESNNNIDYELISTKTKGIKSLKWKEMEANTGKFIEVHCASASFRDVQNFTDLVGQNRKFGMDFSGVDSKGNKVMGLVAGGALASKVRPDEDLLWPVPQHWSLEEAATVPLPYTHAFYCLTIKYRLQPRQSVFVTGGAGALGQAVISICLSMGCTVYTCVSDIRKKQFLTRLFPNLNEKNIGFSRDISFLTMVLCNSKSKGCNVVINCASGQLREFAMRCVGFNDRFLDVNSYDMKQNKDFGMVYLNGDRSYNTVDLSCLFRPENVSERKLLQRVISEGITTGVVRPISHVVYSAEDVEKAFRLLSLSRHRGRVLIKLFNSGPSRIIPRMTYISDGSYVVVSDGAIEQGIHLCNHLVERGARDLIFHLESDRIPGFLKVYIASWKEMGASVTISTDDFEIIMNCNKTLKLSPKINGIFLITPKVRNHGKKVIDNITLVVDNLDQVSRNNCPQLKYFVIFANNSKGFGEQSTFKLKNLCRKRVQLGLPALIVETEALDDSEHVEKSILDASPVPMQAAIKAMEISLRQNSSSTVAYNENNKTQVLPEIVARILGINNMDTIDEELRMKDLVCYETNFEEIKNAIKEFCKLDLCPEYIEEMTIKSLKTLNQSKVKRRSQVEGKLAAFYNFVDHDIFEATEIFVPMITLSSWLVSEKNLYARTTNLLLIPGFEGHHHIFKPLCKNIKIRATTLQYGPDFCNDSIHAIALNLKQQIKKRFPLDPKFYLLGYSFGVNVALEVAALLEKDGLVGVVYCLDSSPDAVRAHLNDCFGNSSERQTQNAVIKHLFHVMTGIKCEELEDDVKNTDDWAEKVDLCVDILKNRVKYSNEYKKALIEAFYKRICLAKSYKPTFEIKSKIVLLKGISPPNDLPADYGLSKYAKNPVEVLEIGADFPSAPYDNKVASIVHQFLDPVLLEEYRTNNFCERYTVETLF